MQQEDLNAYKDAYLESFPFYWDETVLLDAYARKLVAALKPRKRVRALSLGIGRQMVSKAIFENVDLAEYHIVEGAADIIERYKAEANAPDFVQVHHAWFEKIDFDQKFDAIEMGFVLEHVDDPALIVRRFKRFLKPGGFIGMAVPNARSLHRLIGHEAGLLDDVYKLSAEDRQLGHKRYFDLESFKRLAESEGLVVRRARGIMMKPVTTRQLSALNLSADVREALFKVADDLPAISNSLYLEAQMP